MAMPIAMGVPITAAALFETMLVSTASISISKVSTQAGSRPCARYRNTRAR